LENTLVSELQKKRRFVPMRKPLSTLLVGLIFSAVTLLGLFQAATQTDTTDEMIHVASAYLAQTRGEYRFDPEHPALFKHLTALPLHALELSNPIEDTELWENAKVTMYDSWKEARMWSERWVYGSGNPSWLMVFLSRIPGVIALLGLCFVVWRYVSTYYNENLGLWALFFTASTPTLLSHGPLTNTDVPVALAAMGTVWALHAYGDSPNRPRALLVGLLLGVALATKFSAIILLPLAFGWLVWTAIQHRLRGRTVLDLILALAVMMAIIWLAYGFHSASVVIGEGDQSLPLQIINERLSPFGVTIYQIMEVARYILPLDWLKGAVLALGAGITGRGSYILSTTYASGVIFYFPVLLFLKTQLVVIALALWGAITGIRRTIMERVHIPAHVWLLIACGAIAISAGLVSKLSIGIRHISVFLPILAIGVAAAAYTAIQTIPKRWRTHLTISIVLATTLPVVLQVQSLLSFGNVFTLPTAQRWQLMADSNLDWGQQLYALRASMKNLADGDEPLYLNWRWNGDMANALFPEAQRFDPQNLPERGLVAVTATQLTEDYYASLRSLQPISVIAGGSALIYRVGN
jgi:hypothetical protein